MGPLWLVLSDLVLFYVMFLKLCGLCSFKTLGLTPFGLKYHEVTNVFLL